MIWRDTGLFTQTSLPLSLSHQVVRSFRQGGFNTLVSTCVGEEGLDIGEVDLIVCFDAQKSPIRLVQRMGRTGRKRQGRIVVILAEGREERVSGLRGDGVMTRTKGSHPPPQSVSGRNHHDRNRNCSGQDVDRGAPPILQGGLSPPCRRVWRRAIHFLCVLIPFLQEPITKLAFPPGALLAGLTQ